MNPQGARLKFKLRPITDGLFVLLPFAIGIAIATRFAYTWAIDALLLALAFWVYFFVLSGRPLALRCPHCAKVIITDVQWICGFCEQANKKTREFPFIGQCEHCGAKPKAYKCHHRRCGDLIFLSKDELEANFARCLTVTEDVVADRLRKGIDQEILFNQLQAKLEASRKRSPRQKKQESFDTYLSETMAAREIARAKRAEVEHLYKDDKELRERALAAIDEWLERES